MDDGGDATLFVHQGVKVEKNPSLLDQEYENAEKALLNIQHRWPQYWNLLGKVYSKLGKDDESREAFDKTIKDPD